MQEGAQGKRARVRHRAQGHLTSIAGTREAGTGEAGTGEAQDSNQTTVVCWPATATLHRIQPARAPAAPTAPGRPPPPAPPSWRSRSARCRGTAAPAAASTRPPRPLCLRGGYITGSSRGAARSASLGAGGDAAGAHTKKVIDTTSNDACSTPAVYCAPDSAASWRRSARIGSWLAREDWVSRRRSSQRSEICHSALPPSRCRLPAGARAAGDRPAAASEF